MLLFCFLVVLFIVVEVVLPTFFAKMEALKGRYFNEAASSCFVALSLSQKHIAVMVFRINEARGQKTASKFLNKQHQWQSGTICAVY